MIVEDVYRSPIIGSYVIYHENEWIQVVDILSNHQLCNFSFEKEYKHGISERSLVLLREKKLHQMWHRWIENHRERFGSKEK